MLRLCGFQGFNPKSGFCINQKSAKKMAMFLTRILRGFSGRLQTTPVRPPFSGQKPHALNSAPNGGWNRAWKCAKISLKIAIFSGSGGKFGGPGWSKTGPFLAKLGWFWWSGQNWPRANSEGFGGASFFGFQWQNFGPGFWAPGQIFNLATRARNLPILEISSLCVEIMLLRKAIFILKNWFSSQSS